MQQFTVPQFIDVEDKIIGPITTRQFLIILGGGLFLVLMYAVLDFTAFAFAAVLVFIICAVFSFYKINGMPFHFFVLNFIQTSKNPKIRVWNNVIGQIDGLIETSRDLKIINKTHAGDKRTHSVSRLTELALVVDTQGAYKKEEFNHENVKPLEEMELDI